MMKERERERGNTHTDEHTYTETEKIRNEFDEGPPLIFRDGWTVRRRKNSEKKKNT